MLTSPRLRGEVGSRACDPGEGVQVYQLAYDSRREPLTPTLSPQERGEGEERASILRAQLSDFRIAREIVRALAIDRVHHHALAVLQRGLADIGAERRLVVDLAEGDLAERRRHRQAFGRRDQLLRIGRIGFGEDRRGRLDGLVADDRAEARIVVVLGLIGFQELVMVRRLDVVPGITRDDPALGRLFLQRIEIFRLAGEEATPPRGP